MSTLIRSVVTGIGAAVLLTTGAAFAAEQSASAESQQASSERMSGKTTLAAAGTTRIRDVAESPSQTGVGRPFDAASPEYQKFLREIADRSGG
jgi:hypothetical protein